MTIFILYREYGYGEKCIYGATTDSEIADKWESLHYDNDYCVSDNFNDSLPQQVIA